MARNVAETADAQAAPWARLTAGCQTSLAARPGPDVQRIVLVGGPAGPSWSQVARLG
ncbi:hypothetical protein [Streptomyces sp. NPDC055287]